VGRISGSPSRGARAAGRYRRCRSQDSLRPDDLAHPGRPERGPPGRAAGCEVGELGARGSRQRSGRRDPGFRRSGGAPVPLRGRRRHPEPRSRLRLEPSREPPSRAGVRRATQGGPPQARDEPALRRRGLAHIDGCGRRSPPRPQELRHRGLCPGGGGGARRGRRRRCRPPVGGPPGEGPQACRLSGDRAGRGDAAPGGSCHRPHDQRGARCRGHHRRLHRARGRGLRRDASGSRRRHERRSGRDAGRHRREPGVRSACRPRVRPGPRACPASHPPRPVSRRDRGAVPMASPGDAHPGELERRTGGLWHRLDRPTLDRSALRRALGARAPGRVHRRLRAQGLRDRPRALDGGAR